MNTASTAVPLPRPVEPGRPRRKARRFWVIATASIVVGFFMEAVFAGAMLSGVDWARRAHSITAALLIASSVMAGVFSMTALRGLQNGKRLGAILLLLAIVAFVQAAVGAMSAKGANLTWVHVPLGVALVGLAILAASSARRLGGPDER